MEEQPLLIFNASEKNCKHRKSTKSTKSSSFRCTCARCIQLIEFMVIALQIFVVIFDWSSTCNRSLHTWMLVSLSYRPASYIFQWMFIQPCLRYLRRDRFLSSKESLDRDESECFTNLLFCWIIPWLWLIDNDIFLLIWAIAGTLLILKTNTNTDISSVDTCSVEYIMDHMQAKSLYYTMIIVLILSYIYWITTLIISLSLLCCPQLITYCCHHLGYVVSRRKGENKLEEMYADMTDMSQISDMPGIKSTFSFSLTAPSRNIGNDNKSPTNKASVQKKWFMWRKKVGSNPFQPLPNHIFRQFERKLYTKETFSTTRSRQKTKSATPESDKDSKSKRGSLEIESNGIHANILSPNTPSAGFMFIPLEDNENINEFDSTPVSQKIVDNKIITVTSSFGCGYCILCQHKYNDNEVLIVLKCNHMFHEHCSKQWFAQNSLCPICNKNMCVL